MLLQRFDLLVSIAYIWKVWDSPCPLACSILGSIVGCCHYSIVHVFIQCILCIGLYYIYIRPLLLKIIYTLMLAICSLGTFSACAPVYTPICSLCTFSTFAPVKWHALSASILYGHVVLHYVL